MQKKKKKIKFGHFDSKQTASLQVILNVQLKWQYI